VKADVFDDAHVAVLVTFCVLLSLKVAVAVKGWVAPTSKLGLAGEIDIDVTVGAVVTVNGNGLLALPDTVTTTLALPAPTPAGTVTTIPEGPQSVGVAVMPPKVTVLDA
jgi:hypothetical protein